MIKIFGLFFSAFFTIVLYGQSFEGKITYRTRIHSKLPNVTDEQFTNMLGDTQEYYIKGNQYKSVVNGVVMQWQLYVPSENRLYNKTSNTDVIMWNDGDENKDSVLSAKLIPNADTILGYSCDKLVLSCVGGRQEYEFNKSVASVNPALFSRHKSGNWFTIISHTGALPLQYQLDNPQFTLTSVAVAVTPMKLNDSLFVLPAGAKTQKSNY